MLIEDVACCMLLLSLWEDLRDKNKRNKTKEQAMEKRLACDKGVCQQAQ